MVERLRSIKLGHCSADAWSDLLQVMNGRTDVVLPRQDYLDQVCQCHARRVDSAQLLVQRRHLPSLTVPGRKYYSVQRLELMAFVNAHGKVCEHE